MKYDKPLLAALIGAIAIIPHEAISLTAKYLGWTSMSVFEMNSKLFDQYGSWIVGVLTTLLTSAVVGFIFYEVLRIIGVDYIILKGIAASMTSWLIFEAILQMVRGTSGEPVSGHFIHAFGAAVAGLVIGYMFERFLISPVPENHPE
ncbi:MAG: hypothetical protein CVV03_10840 [Firmicutes bacterium HGW-Firmicutes-8]|nr:MAG: hypothetical protein CVV03_10840 [Firmicutes bacterium HGW-Firmicutes-8]